MTAQQLDIDYNRIETAIGFISRHLQDQPSLEDIAAVINVSPIHFHRMFLKWAGVSPKRFMQFLSLTHNKKKLQQGAALLKGAHESGRSVISRFHNLPVSIEVMPPGEYEADGVGLVIDYDFVTTPFGQVIVASTSNGICHMAFAPVSDAALAGLRKRFPHANCHNVSTRPQQKAIIIFSENQSSLPHITLHLAGSKFQIKVWKALLKIPMGVVASYADIARHIGRPRAARAVGSAIASNPVAFLIPCHRVIQKNGVIGGYMWGEVRKQAILGWESAQTDVMA